MPNQFVCKFCGMITDNPTITPAPYLLYGKPLLPTTHYCIECPICLKGTFFERLEPFPTDKSE